MTLLLDEMMPRSLAEHLPGHVVLHVLDLGWANVKNGQLLNRCDERSIDVLETKDWQMPYQQNMRGRKIALAVLRPQSQLYTDLVALTPTLLSILPEVLPGTVHLITPSQGD